MGASAVSTEKELAISHPGFWRTTLPLSESFIRTMNRALERYALPMHSSVPAARRGLVNEAAFQVFVTASSSQKSVTELDASAIDAAWTRAAVHVQTMRQFSRAPVDAVPGVGELDESVALARRIAEFFSRGAPSRLLVEPTFNGCGWVDEARGDVLAGQTLFEIKAGERHFRSVDLYQLLIYCALNFATKALDIMNVGLVNPRVGIFTILDLDELCNECAGSPAADVLDEILQYISEPLGAYAH